jgi:hypothetical protein
MPDEISYLIWDVPPAKWTVKKKFVGSWRITELQGFDADYIDLCGPGKLKISSRGTGHMNFGAVGAELDCKMDDLDDRVLRFSFEGGDEGDPICGRGYCLVDGDLMVGRIFRHYSDEFGFKASRLTKEKNG